MDLILIWSTVWTVFESLIWGAPKGSNWAIRTRLKFDQQLLVSIVQLPNLIEIRSAVMELKHANR
jgi:hypothetical protein